MHYIQVNSSAIPLNQIECMMLGNIEHMHSATSINIKIDQRENCIFYKCMECRKYASFRWLGNHVVSF